MKKSIFSSELKNPKFKAVYKAVSAKMSLEEQKAKSRHKLKVSKSRAITVLTK